MRRAGTGPVRWAAAALVFAALAVMVAWLGRRDGTAPTPGGQPQPAAPLTLALRLTLVTGTPDEDAAAVIRLYSARARLARTVQDAAAAGRPWNGTIAGGSAAPAQVRLGSVDWRAILALELVDESGVATRAQDGALSVISAPEGSLTFGAADTHTVILAIRSAALPPPGGRLRVRLAHAAANGVSNTATTAAAPADQVALFTGSARAAELLRRFDLVSRRAAELVAAAPASPVGYWYRGVALEATGDKAGALDAYQAAADRIAPGGQEPPVGLDLRMARLRTR
jgi:hypothetical protein